MQKVYVGYEVVLFASIAAKFTRLASLCPRIVFIENLDSECIYFFIVVSLSAATRLFLLFLCDFFTRCGDIRIILSQLVHAALHYSIKHVLIMHSGIHQLDHHNNGAMNRAALIICTCIRAINTWRVLIRFACYRLKYKSYVSY